jgi:hypothetical protein
VQLLLVAEKNIRYMIDGRPVLYILFARTHKAPGVQVC